MTRNDNRNFDQLRKVKLQTDVNKFAEGSCLIEMGDTRVLCTATFEEKVPMWMKGQGGGWVTAEYGMLPRSTQTRMARDKKSGRTAEIQRLVGRALRSVVDLRALGENTVWIDCDVLQADGGTRTASITGGFVALVKALEKMRKRGVIRDIPVNDYLAAISVGIFEGTLILDLNYQEDSRAEVDMNIVQTSSGGFVEIQGTAEQKTFSKNVFDGMLKLAEKGIAELIEHQRGILRDVLLK
jgi:ribonuclease PH